MAASPRAVVWALVVTASCCWLGLLGGCLREESRGCGNGGICPPGLLCVDTGGAASRGICAAGSCGDGSLDANEACDDGNNLSGDGCPADCTPPCGDGVRDPGEGCDDANVSDGDGCSADCRSLDGISLISPATVSFVAIEGTSLPAAVIVVIRFAYHDDLALVGEVSGSPLPSWLSIAERASAAGTAELELRVTETAVVGRRSTFVRLTISRRDGASPEIFDLPVSYRVEPSDLNLAVTPAALAITSTFGDPPAPPRALIATFNGEVITLASAPPWVAVSLPSDSTRSPAAFAASIEDPSLPVGTELSGELVFRTRRGTLEREARVPIAYEVVAPPELALDAAPATLTFNAVAGGARPASQTIQAMFNGARVSVVEAPSWVGVTAVSDPQTSPASFTVAVNTTALADRTTQDGALVLRTTRGSEQRLLSIRLVYRLSELQRIAPYLGTAGRSGVLLVRGREFPPDVPLVIRVGDHELSPVVPDNDTQLTLSYPALPAGRYPVTMLGASGVDPTGPELVIVPPAPFVYQALDVSGSMTRLVYDAERRTLYGVNPADQRLEHFAYVGGANGTWTALPPHAVSQLADIAMAPGGRSLIVVQRQTINHMSLTDGLWTLIPHASRPGPRCEFFQNVAAANNGRFHLTTELAGSGICPAYLYDMRDHSLVQIGEFAGGCSGASEDGSRIYAGAYDYGRFAFYDARSDTTFAANISFAALTISVSRDASRVIVDGSKVYDREVVFTGNLPNRGRHSALASSDSSRALVYVQDYLGTRLEEYDLDGPLQPGAIYPLRRTIPLPDKANPDSQYDGQYPVRMTTSPDDSVVFIAGVSRLLIVPLGMPTIVSPVVPSGMPPVVPSAVFK